MSDSAVVVTSIAVAAGAGLLGASEWVYYLIGLATAGWVFRSHFGS